MENTTWKLHEILHIKLCRLQVSNGFETFHDIMQNFKWNVKYNKLLFENK
jgi:hypothetical protein